MPQSTGRSRAPPEVSPCGGRFTPTRSTTKLRFFWQERGGPTVLQPAHKGFGTVLLEHAIAGIDSAPSIDFAPAGLTYQTETPLDMLTPVQPELATDCVQ